MATITITITKTQNDAYEVSLYSRDRDLFLELIEELKDRIPSDERSYDPMAKCWKISDQSLLESWLDYARENGAKIKWEDGSRPPRPGRMVHSDAYTTLHLLPDAPPELVKAAHKILARLHHPDLPGGNLEVMQKVNAAFDVLTKGGTK